jgi:PAS domain S-box-containing protein
MGSPADERVGVAEIANLAWPAALLAPDGRIRAANPALAALLGVPPAELCGTTLADRIAAADHAAWARLLAGDGPPEATVRFGDRRVAVTLSPRGALLLLLGHDVTPLVETLRATRREVSRLGDLLSIGSEHHWELDPGLTELVILDRRDESGVLVRDEAHHPFANWVRQVESDPNFPERVALPLRERRPFHEVVLRRQGRNGGIHWVRLSGLPVYDETGAFAGYRGVAADVTAQVEAEAALRASEQRFRDLLETASDWWWETDAELRYTYLSANFEEITGTPRERFLGRIPSRAEGGSGIRELLETQQPFRDVLRKKVRLGGRPRWVRTNGKPIFDADGNFLGYRGTATDVTAYIEAEEEAQRVQRRLIRAIENIPQPFVIFDRDDRIYACNAAYREMHRDADGKTAARPGVSAREMLRWRMASGRFAPLGEAERQALAAPTVFTKLPVDYRIRLTDGRTMVGHIHALENGDKVSIWTDVTAMRQAEEKRREIEAQLHHSQRLEALGTLAGGIAHDLNNTLVPVLALSRLLVGRLAGDPFAAEQLELIHQAAERGRGLVRQILAFSRKERPEMRVVDMAQLVANGLTLIRAGLPQEVMLRTALAAVPPVSGDPSQLGQVLLNLVTNAAQALDGDGGTITVSLGAVGERVVLAVEDTGCGMDQAVRERIFEPFFTTKEAGEGTGLGLSVVHGIVASHGGAITVASEPQRGSRFEISLPALPASARASSPTIAA